MSDPTFPTFEAFWPYYVGEHRLPLNRMLHAFGTLTALLVGLSALVSLDPKLIPAALVCGYGPAWLGHFVLEKNRPATLTYPLYSLRGDFRMVRLMLLGRMEAEIARLGGGGDG